MARETVNRDSTAARGGSSERIPWKIFWSVLIVNLALLIAGVATTFPWAHIEVAGLAVALVAIGIFTFLMLLVDSGDIRSALTAAFLFVYLALMGASLNETVSGKMVGGFGKVMFDNFSTLFGVIVAFYFGGKALEKVAESVGPAWSNREPKSGTRTDAGSSGGQ
jgi:hypothetical protein